jgi:hypothetical protein
MRAAESAISRVFIVNLCIGINDLVSRPSR